MKDNTKRTFKFAGELTKNVFGWIAEGTYNYIKAEGHKGTKKKIQRMIYKLELKELRLGLIYKFTPFGNNDDINNKIRNIRRVNKELFNMTLEQNPDIVTAKKIMKKAC